MSGRPSQGQAGMPAYNFPTAYPPPMSPTPSWAGLNAGYGPVLHPNLPRFGPVQGRTAFDQLFYDSGQPFYDSGQPFYDSGQPFHNYSTAPEDYTNYNFPFGNPPYFVPNLTEPREASGQITPFNAGSTFRQPATMSGVKVEESPFTQRSYTRMSRKKQTKPVTHLNQFGGDEKTPGIVYPEETSSPDLKRPSPKITELTPKSESDPDRSRTSTELNTDTDKSPSDKPRLHSTPTNASISSSISLCSESPGLNLNTSLTQQLTPIPNVNKHDPKLNNVQKSATPSRGWSTWTMPADSIAKDSSPGIKKNDINKAEPVFKKNDSNKTEPVIEKNDINKAEPVFKKNDSNKTEPVIEKNDINKTEPVIKKNDINKTEPVIKKNDINKTEPVIKKNDINKTEPVIKKNDMNKTEDVNLSSEKDSHGLEKTVTNYMKAQAEMVESNVEKGEKAEVEKPVSEELASALPSVPKVTDLRHKSSQTEGPVSGEKKRVFEHAPSSHRVIELQAEVCRLRAQLCLNELQRERFHLEMDMFWWKSNFQPMVPSPVSKTMMAVQEHLQQLMRQMRQIEVQRDHWLRILKSGRELQELPKFTITFPSGEVIMPVNAVGKGGNPYPAYPPPTTPPDSLSSISGPSPAATFQLSCSTASSTSFYQFPSSIASTATVSSSSYESSRKKTKLDIEDSSIADSWGKLPTRPDRPGFFIGKQTTPAFIPAFCAVSSSTHVISLTESKLASSAVDTVSQLSMLMASCDLGSSCVTSAVLSSESSVISSAKQSVGSNVQENVVVSSSVCSFNGEGQAEAGATSEGDFSVSSVASIHSSGIVKSAAYGTPSSSVVPSTESQIAVSASAVVNSIQDLGTPPLITSSVLDSIQALSSQERDNNGSGVPLPECDPRVPLGSTTEALQSNCTDEKVDTLSDNSNTAPFISYSPSVACLKTQKNFVVSPIVSQLNSLVQTVDPTSLRGVKRVDEKPQHTTLEVRGQKEIQVLLKEGSDVQVESGDDKQQVVRNFFEMSGEAEAEDEKHRHSTLKSEKLSHKQESFDDKVESSSDKSYDVFVDAKESISEINNSVNKNESGYFSSTCGLKSIASQDVSDGHREKQITPQLSPSCPDKDLVVPDGGQLKVTSVGNSSANTSEICSEESNSLAPGTVILNTEGACLGSQKADSKTDVSQATVPRKQLSHSMHEREQDAVIEAVEMASFQARIDESKASTLDELEKNKMNNMKESEVTRHETKKKDNNLKASDDASLSQSISDKHTDGVCDNRSDQLTSTSKNQSCKKEMDMFALESDTDDDQPSSPATDMTKESTDGIKQTENSGSCRTSPDKFLSSKNQNSDSSPEQMPLPSTPPRTAPKPAVKSDRQTGQDVPLLKLSSGTSTEEAVARDESGGDVGMTTETVTVLTEGKGDACVQSNLFLQATGQIMKDGEVDEQVSAGVSVSKTDSVLVFRRVLEKLKELYPDKAVDAVWLQKTAQEQTSLLLKQLERPSPCIKTSDTLSSTTWSDSGMIVSSAETEKLLPPQPITVGTLQQASTTNYNHVGHGQSCDNPEGGKELAQLQREKRHQVGNGTPQFQPHTSNRTCELSLKRDEILARQKETITQQLTEKRDEILVRQKETITQQAKLLEMSSSIQQNLLTLNQRSMANPGDALLTLELESKLKQYQALLDEALVLGQKVSDLDQQQRNLQMALQRQRPSTLFNPLQRMSSVIHQNTSSSRSVPSFSPLQHTSPPLTIPQSGDSFRPNALFVPLKSTVNPSTFQLQQDTNNSRCLFNSIQTMYPNFFKPRSPALSDHLGAVSSHRSVFQPISMPSSKQMSGAFPSFPSPTGSFSSTSGAFPSPAGAFPSPAGAFPSFPSPSVVFGTGSRSSSAVSHSLTLSPALCKSTASPTLGIGVQEPMAAKLPALGTSEGAAGSSRCEEERAVSDRSLDMPGTFSVFGPSTFSIIDHPSSMAICASAESSAESSQKGANIPDLGNNPAKSSTFGFTGSTLASTEKEKISSSPQSQKWRPVPCCTTSSSSKPALSTAATSSPEAFMPLLPLKPIKFTANRYAALAMLGSDKSASLPSTTDQKVVSVLKFSDASFSAAMMRSEDSSAQTRGKKKGASELEESTQIASKKRNVQTAPSRQDAGLKDEDSEEEAWQVSTSKRRGSRGGAKKNLQRQRSSAAPLTPRPNTRTKQKKEARHIVESRPVSCSTPQTSSPASLSQVNLQESKSSSAGKIGDDKGKPYITFSGMTATGLPNQLSSGAMTGCSVIPSLMSLSVKPPPGLETTAGSNRIASCSVPQLDEFSFSKKLAKTAEMLGRSRPNINKNFLGQLVRSNEAANQCRDSPPGDLFGKPLSKGEKDDQYNDQPKSSGTVDDDWQKVGKKGKLDGAKPSQTAEATSVELAKQAFSNASASTKNPPPKMTAYRKLCLSIENDFPHLKQEDIVKVIDEVKRSYGGHFHGRLFSDIMKDIRTVVLRHYPEKLRSAQQHKPVFTEMHAVKTPKTPSAGKKSEDRIWQPCTSTSNTAFKTIEEECSICLVEFSTQSPYLLECGHSFHKQCIDKWVKNQGERTCPICRTIVLMTEEFPHLGRDSPSHVQPSPPLDDKEFPSLGCSPVQR